MNRQAYQIQGIALEDLAKEYGTPLYIYDADKILSQYTRLKNAFSGTRVKIKYAAKALTNQAVLQLLQKAGAGIDTVSIEEVRLALQAGYLPADINFTPNCSSFAEIEEAVTLGVVINLDNLPFLERFGQKYGPSYSCCLRINPHVKAGGNEKIMTGHRESKFGISHEQVEEIRTIVSRYKIKVNGLHQHTGSDIKDAEAFVKAADVVFGLALTFPDLEYVDLGGGFKVAYKEGDITTNIEELGAKMTAAFEKLCAQYGKKLELWFEPGKFLVSECGLLLVRANVVKETPACTFVGVDSGLNHLIRPMMYGAYHSIYNASKPEGPMKTYNVVGYICETDTLGSGLSMTEVSEGDLLAIQNAGAYGFSMSSNYNSRLRPAEVLVYKGKSLLIRRRETMEDLLRTQVAVDLF